LSKFEGKIRAAGEGSIELDQLFVGLGRGLRIATDRHDALAHYLSGEEGWRDAVTTLGGTFAKAPPPSARLTAREEP
jgi:hypothetical protein